MLARTRRLDPSAKNKLSVAIAFAVTLIIAVGWFGYKYVFVKSAPQTQSAIENDAVSEIKNAFKDSSTRLKKEWQNLKISTESFKGTE